MDVLKLVYIAGYGRSGSTIYDAHVTSTIGGFSLGEATFIFDHLLNDKPCTCGAALSDCSFWGDWATAKLELSASNLKRQAKLYRRLDAFVLPPKQRRESLQLHTDLLRYAAQKSSRDRIVDSSKSARKAWRRMLWMQRSAEIDVEPVLVLRDPLAVAATSKKGSNRALGRGRASPSVFRMVRSGLSCSLVNVVASILLERRFERDQWSTVRYEDFVASNDGAELSWSQGPVGDHAIGGSRHRLKRTVRIESGTGFDETSWSLRWLKLALWPARQRFGYG